MIKNSNESEYLENIKKKLLKCKVSLIGIGYVGLPLAIEFVKRKNCNILNLPMKRNVVGFDINQERINELKQGIDSTREVNELDLDHLKTIYFSSDEDDLKYSDVYIVTVPTPIDQNKRPNLDALKNASKIVGKSIGESLKKVEASNLEKPLIIFESTVYPGVTEEICIPIIEKESRMVINNDFFCGYSPERINPGDTTYKLTNIKKVTSGSCSDARILVDFFYASIIDAGTFSVEDIRIAEAAKVIENTQRDLNIALINELALIFKRLNIDTLKVLEAAETKWNFIPFRPGLVGGHCIGVDPYYLTYKAEEVGYYPEIVLAGRKINDGMSKLIAEEILTEISKKKKSINKIKVLLLGVTFKENCPDTRNSKSIEIIYELEKFGVTVCVVDPVANSKNFVEKYNREILCEMPNIIDYEAIIISVGHYQFKKKDFVDWEQIAKNGIIIYDVKGILPRSINAIRL